MQKLPNTYLRGTLISALLVLIFSSGISSAQAAGGFMKCLSGGTYTTCGTTERDAWLVEDCEDLLSISTAITAGSGSLTSEEMAEGFYRLAGDIDCSASNPTDGSFNGSVFDTFASGIPGGVTAINPLAGTGFTPIGLGSTDYFSGSFDGRWYEISDLYIERDGEHNVGLFGTIDGNAVVKNVSLQSAYVKADENVGVLAGNAEANTTMYALAIEGEATANVGDAGIVAGVHKGTIENSYASGSAMAVFGSAGFVADVDVTTNISNSFAIVDITAAANEYGIADAAQTTDSYYVGTCSVACSDVGNAQSAATLKTTNFGEGIYANWQTNAWEFRAGENEDYPVHRLFLENGNGESATPFQIDTCFDLQAVGSDGYMGYDANYILNTNVDCSAAIPGMPGYTGSVWHADAEGFDTIGSAIDPFTGTFDGNGNTISNLYINKGGLSSNQGLFAQIGGAGSVFDLSMTNTTVMALDYAGALAGESYGNVESVFASNTTIDGDSSGGLIGWNLGTLSGSYVQADVTGSLEAGGLVGINGGTIINSYAEGTVSGDDSIGGLVGWNEVGSITNSYAAVDVSATTTDFGGLVGLDEAAVTRSFFDSDLTNCGSACADVITFGTGSEYFYTANQTLTWDFTNFWEYVSGVALGKPVLQAQNLSTKPVSATGSIDAYGTLQLFPTSGPTSFTGTLYVSGLIDDNTASVVIESPSNPTFVDDYLTHLEASLGTTPFTYASLPTTWESGLHTGAVTVTDVWGNTSTVEKEFLINNLTTSGNIQPLSGYLSNNTQVVFCADLTDVEDQDMRIEVSIDGGGAIIGDTITEDGTSCATGTVSYAPHTWTFQACDELECGPNSAERSFEIVNDFDGPVTTIHSPINDYYNVGEAPLFTGSSTDAYGVALNGVELRVDYPGTAEPAYIETYLGPQALTTDWTFDITGTLAGGDVVGMYTGTITATDIFGNTDQAVETFYLTHPPAAGGSFTINESSDTTIYTNDNEPGFSGSVTDSDGDNVYAIFMLSGSTSIEYLTGSTVASGGISEFNTYGAPLADDSYDVSIIACDEYDVCEDPASTGVTLIVDTQGVTFTIDSYAEQEIFANAGPTIFTGTLTEDVLIGANEALFMIKDESGDYWNGTAFTPAWFGWPTTHLQSDSGTTVTWTPTITFPSSWEAGDYEGIIRAEDEAGTLSSLTHDFTINALTTTGSTITPLSGTITGTGVVQFCSDVYDEDNQDINAYFTVNEVDVYTGSVVLAAGEPTSGVSCATGSLIEGDHSWTVTVCDELDCTADATSYDITVDLTAPTLTFITPTGETFGENGPVSITGTIQDTVAFDTGFISIEVAGVADIVNIPSLTGTLYTWDFLDTATYTQGAYTITGSVTDLAGNTTTATTTFSVDTSAPTITIEIPEDLKYYDIDNQPVFFSGTLADNEGFSANTAEYELTFGASPSLNGYLTHDGGTGAIWQEDLGSWITNNGGTGSYSLAITLEDDFGNETTETHFFYMTTAPYLNGMAINAREDVYRIINDTTPTFGVYATDADGDDFYAIFEVEYASGTVLVLTGAVTASETDSFFPGTAFATNGIDPLVEGIYNVNTRYCDIHDVCNYIPNHRTLEIDLTAPAVTIDSFGSGTIFPRTGPTTFTGTFAESNTIDANTGTITIENENGEFWNGTIFTTAGEVFLEHLAVSGSVENWSASGALLPVWATGSYEITISAPDVATNIGSGSATFIVNSYPEVGATYSPLNDTIFATGAVQICADVYDDNEQDIYASVLVDGVTTYTGSTVSAGIGSTSGTSCFTGSFAEGDHEWVLSICDDLDCATFPTPRTFTVDLTAPELVFTFPTGEMFGIHGPQNLSGTIEDNVYISTGTINYMIDSVSGFTAHPEVLSGDIYNFGYAFSGTYTTGTYTITGSVSDSVGNQAVETTTFSVDATAPVITIDVPMEGIHYNILSQPDAFSGTFSDNVGFAANTAHYVLDFPGITKPNLEEAIIHSSGSAINWSFDVSSWITTGDVGDYILTVYLTDIHGNETSETINFGISNAPVVDAFSIDNKFDTDHVATKDTQATFSGTVTDPEGEDAYIIFHLDNGINQYTLTGTTTTSGGDSIFTGSMYDLAGITLAEGNYDLTMTSCDENETCVTSDPATQVIIDTTRVYVQPVSPYHLTYYLNEGPQSVNEFTGLIFDSGSLEANSMTVEIIRGTGHWDGTDFVAGAQYLPTIHDATMSTGAVTFTYSGTLPDWEPGEYSFYGRATDEAGVPTDMFNLFNTYKHEFYINDFVSTGSITPLADSFTNSGQVEFCADLSDTDEQELTAYFNLDGSLVFSGSTIPAGSGFTSGTSCAPQTLTQGQYEFTTLPCDELECANETVAQNFTVDLTDPYLTLAPQFATIYHPGNVPTTFTGLVSDNYGVGANVVDIRLINVTPGHPNENEYWNFTSEIFSSTVASSDYGVNLATSGAVDVVWTITGLVMPTFAGEEMYMLAPAVSDLAGNRVYPQYFFTINEIPNIPTYKSEFASGDVLDTLLPQLTAVFTDPDNNTGYVELQVSTGSLTDCLNGIDIAANSGPVATSFDGADEAATYVPSLENNTTFTWCARNYDGVFYSEWTEMGDFTTNAIKPEPINIYSTTATGSYLENAEIDVLVQFSESVLLTGGFLEATLNTGDVVELNTITGQPDTLSGTYTVPGTLTGVVELMVTSLDLPIGVVVKDAGLNPAILDPLPSANISEIAICDAFTTYYADLDGDLFPDELNTMGYCEGFHDAPYMLPVHGFDQDDSDILVLDMCEFQSDCLDNPAAAVCDFEAGVCIPSCNEPQLDCATYDLNNPYCATHTGYCVECLQDTHCPADGDSLECSEINTCVEDGLQVATRTAAKASSIAHRAARDEFHSAGNKTSTLSNFRAVTDEEMRDSKRTKVLDPEILCPVVITENKADTTINNISIDKLDFDLVWSASHPGSFQIHLIDGDEIATQVDEGFYTLGDHRTKIDLSEAMEYDYAAMSQEWKEKLAGEYDENFDINQDGQVDASDYSQFYARWSRDSQGRSIKLSLWASGCMKTMTWDINSDLFINIIEVYPEGKEIEEATSVILKGADELYYRINDEQSFKRYIDPVVVQPGDTLHYYGIEAGNRTADYSQEYPATYKTRQNGDGLRFFNPNRFDTLQNKNGQDGAAGLSAVLEDVLDIIKAAITW